MVSGLSAQPVPPDLAAAIAARYGASLSPGTVVQYCATGQSARPYPVWDEGKQALIVPDWKEQAAARKRVGIRASAAARRRGKAMDEALVARLRDLHATGASAPAMAVALGLRDHAVRTLLGQFGLKVERVAPGPTPQTVARIALISGMIAAGKSRAAIAEAAGFADIKYLGQFVHRSMPGTVLPATQRRNPKRLLAGPGCGGAGRADAMAYRVDQADRIRAMVAEGVDLAAIGAALDIRNQPYLRRVVRAAVPGIALPNAAKGDFTDRDATILKLLPDRSVRDVAQRMGLTKNQVMAGVKRLRAIGALPSSASVRDGDPARRMGRGRRPGAAVHVERNAAIMALHMSGATVEAIMRDTGLSREVIKRVVRKSGDSIRNDRMTLPALRLSQLPDLVARGMTGQQIADLWGCKLATVYALASRGGVSLNGTMRAHNSGTVTPRVAARREMIRTMIRRGMTHAQMLEILQINQSTLSYDIKAAGLSGTSAYTLSRRKGRDAERRAA